MLEYKFVTRSEFHWTKTCFQSQFRAITQHHVQLNMFYVFWLFIYKTIASWGPENTNISKWVSTFLNATPLSSLWKLCVLNRWRPATWQCLESFNFMQMKRTFRKWQPIVKKFNSIYIYIIFRLLPPKCNKSRCLCGHSLQCRENVFAPSSFIFCILVTLKKINIIKPILILHNDNAIKYKMQFLNVFIY